MGMTSSEQPVSQQETEPLLPRSATISFLDLRSEGDQRAPQRLQRCLALPDASIIISVFLLQFLISFAKQIIEVPTIAVLEKAICVRYFNSHDVALTVIDESMCSGNTTVQNHLSHLIGWKFFFDNLPGLFTAIYFGSLSDRFGRRPILSLFCVGTLCSYAWIVAVCYAYTIFPPELIWASSFFIILGAGGQRVCKAIQFTIIADTFGQPRRTRYMYLLASIPHISKLVAPPIAGLLMNVAEWIPFAVAIGCLLIGILVIWMMPESSIHEPPTSPLSADNPTSPLLLDSETPNVPEDTSETVREEPEVSHPERSVMLDLRHLLSTPTLPFCFALFLFRPFAFISRAFIYQHASESFHWPMSRTTWLRVAQAAGSSIVTLILLPLLSLYLANRHRLQKNSPNGTDDLTPSSSPRASILTHVHNSKTRDLNTIRISLFIAAFGFFTLYSATTSWHLILGLVVCGLSEGLDPGLQALATTLVHKVYNARLLTFMSVLEISGKLAGGPVMGWLFGIGRGVDDGHGSSGLSFAVSAGMLLVLGLGSLVVRLED